MKIDNITISSCKETGVTNVSVNDPGFKKQMDPVRYLIKEECNKKVKKLTDALRMALMENNRLKQILNIKDEDSSITKQQ